MPFKDTPDGTTHFCTHRDDNDVLQCRICLPEKNVSPLKQLQEEQERKFDELVLPMFKDKSITAESALYIRRLYLFSLKEYGEMVIEELSKMTIINGDGLYDNGYEAGLLAAISLIKESLE